MNDVSITTKTVLNSGDSHVFHFDSLRDAIIFIDAFETLIKTPELIDDVEATYIEFTDGLNTVTTVL